MDSEKAYRTISDSLGELFLRRKREGKIPYTPEELEADVWAFTMADRQTPKEVVSRRRDGLSGTCPVCRAKVNYTDHQYCGWCSQKLDWRQE